MQNKGAQSEKEANTMKVKLLEHGRMPQRGRPTDAGFDIYLPEDVTFKPGKTTIVNTGVCIQLPHGYMGSVYIRSGIASRLGQKLVIQNPPIDEGYTGEIHLIFLNTSLFKSYKFKKGDRVCQLVVHKIFDGGLTLAGELDASLRGDSWAGSSGR